MCRKNSICNLLPSGLHFYLLQLNKQKLYNKRLTTNHTNRLEHFIFFSRTKSTVIFILVHNSSHIFNIHTFIHISICIYLYIYICIILLHLIIQVKYSTKYSRCNLLFINLYFIFLLFVFNITYYYFA